MNKYFENIEVYFNKRMVESNINKGTFENIDVNIVKDVAENGFNARRFALDEKYRNTTIDMFDKL